MEYELEKATLEEIQLLEEYKEKTILEYAQELTEEELEKIKNYIQENVPKDIYQYYKIMVNQQVIGCILIKEQGDLKCLDELYIEESYRNQGIGTDILNDITHKYYHVSLWVYKKNTRAITLYQRMGFKILNETKTRYYMEYKKEKQV